jgi:hypothetical protein
MKTFDDLENFLLDTLPHGSGIDCEWVVVIEKNRIVCKNSIHALNENGFYMGFIPFTVKLPIIDGIIQCHGFKLTAHGWKNYLTQRYWPLYKDYVEQCLLDSLPVSIFTSEHNLMYSILGV